MGMKKWNRHFKWFVICYEELFYYLFFGFLFMAKGIGLDEGNALFRFLALAALTCLAIKLGLTKHSLKEWMVMLLLVLLGCLIWMNSGEKAAIAAMLVMVGIKNVPLRRLYKVCLGIWTIAFAVSFVLGYFHIRDGVVVVHEKLGLGPVIRWSFGYTHPNVLHISYFILVALILLVCDLHDRELLKLSAVLLLGNIFIFLYSVSYTGIMLVTGYLVLNWFLDVRKKFSKAEAFLLQCIMPFCVIFPLAGPFLFYGKLFAFFNKLLSTRFELVYNLFSGNPPHMFGRELVFTGDGHLTLDSSFAYLLMYYGIAAFVIFVAAYFLLIRRLLREERRQELALVMAIVVAGVTEQFLFNLSFKNLSFFLLGEMLFAYLETRKTTNAVWNREFALLPWGPKEVKLPAIRDDVCLAGAGRRVCIGTALAAGILAACIYIMAVKLPDGVYVSRRLTDYRNLEEEMLLDTEQLSEENNLVIGYNGSEEGLYYFSGNIIILEFVRGIAGAFVLGVFGSGMLLIVITKIVLCQRPAG